MATPNNDESGLKKGPWSPEEDKKLVHGNFSDEEEHLIINLHSIHGNK